MFEQQLRFEGRHAGLLKKYSKDKQAEESFRFIVRDYEMNNRNVYIFDNMLTCYMVAALIGIYKKKKTEIDLSGENKNLNANIFTEKLIRERQTLIKIYQLMIFTEQNGSIDSVVKQAFSVSPEKTDEDYLSRMNAYARTGLDIIDEYFRDCETTDDLAYKMMDFANLYKVGEL